jgi:hypothetical protein
VRPHPQRRLSGPPRSGGCMAHAWSVSGGFQIYQRQTVLHSHISMGGALLQHTPHNLSLHLYSFNIFSSVVKSLARLVIEDQEHLEDVWYDQYNVLHCDSCHVFHLVVVLILSL